ncbi:hypothetical protein DFJ74DRAFT_237950 [Hyaloraphidium curvatum]|nr:hypothetical protein DFJ74DRAFT_237950 [Hyaloraphidium curvatum]
MRRGVALLLAAVVLAAAMGAAGAEGAGPGAPAAARQVSPNNNGGNANWVLGQTCCFRCDYPAGCCCALRPRPVETVTITSWVTRLRLARTTTRKRRRFLNKSRTRTTAAPTARSDVGQRSLYGDPVALDVPLDVEDSFSASAGPLSPESDGDPAHRLERRHLCPVCPPGIDPSPWSSWGLHRRTNGQQWKPCCARRTATRTVTRTTSVTSLRPVTSLGPGPGTTFGPVRMTTTRRRVTTRSPKSKVNPDTAGLTKTRTRTKSRTRTRTRSTSYSFTSSSGSRTATSSASATSSSTSGTLSSSTTSRSLTSSSSSESLTSSTSSATTSESRSLTGTTSESASATATTSESQSLTATTSESASATATTSESQSLTATTSESLSRTATTSESQSLTATTSESQSRTATTSESQSLTATTSESLSRTATTSESQSLTATTSESRSRTATTSESQSLTATTSESASATATTSESQSLTATTSESLSRTATTSESQSLTATTSESASATATTSESQSLTATTSESLSRTATTSESQSLTATTSESASATATTSESQSLTATTSESLSRTATTSESQSLTASTSESQSLTGTTSESATASVTSSSTSESLTLTTSESRTTSVSATTSVAGCPCVFPPDFGQCGGSGCPPTWPDPAVCSSYTVDNNVNVFAAGDFTTKDGTVEAEGRFVILGTMQTDGSQQSVGAGLHYPRYGGEPTTDAIRWPVVLLRHRESRCGCLHGDRPRRPRLRHGFGRLQPRAADLANDPDEQLRVLRDLVPAAVHDGRARQRAAAELLRAGPVPELPGPHHGHLRLPGLADGDGDLQRGGLPGHAAVRRVVRNPGLQHQRGRRGRERLRPRREQLPGGEHPHHQCPRRPHAAGGQLQLRQHHSLPDHPHPLERARCHHGAGVRGRPVAGELPRRAAVEHDPAHHAGDQRAYLHPGEHHPRAEYRRRTRDTQLPFQRGAAGLRGRRVPVPLKAGSD